MHPAAAAAAAAVAGYWTWARNSGLCSEIIFGCRRLLRKPTAASHRLAHVHVRKLWNFVGAQPVRPALLEVPRQPPVGPEDPAHLRGLV